jgi:hypothetical protein
MSEYADGFDDGKGEKFDELMLEIVTLREQLAASRQAAEIHKLQAEKNHELATKYYDFYTKAVKDQLKEKNNG